MCIPNVVQILSSNCFGLSDLFVGIWCKNNVAGGEACGNPKACSWPEKAWTRWPMGIEQKAQAPKPRDKGYPHQYKVRRRKNPVPLKVTRGEIEESKFPPAERTWVSGFKSRTPGMSQQNVTNTKRGAVDKSVCLFCSYFCLLFIIFLYSLHVIHRFYVLVWFTIQFLKWQWLPSKALNRAMPGRVLVLNYRSVLLSKMANKKSTKYLGFVFHTHISFKIKRRSQLKFHFGSLIWSYIQSNANLLLPITFFLVNGVSWFLYKLINYK